MAASSCTGDVSFPGRPGPAGRSGPTERMPDGVLPSDPSRTSPRAHARGCMQLRVTKPSVARTGTSITDRLSPPALIARLTPPELLNFADCRQAFFRAAVTQDAPVSVTGPRQSLQSERPHSTPQSEMCNRAITPVRTGDKFAAPSIAVSTSGSGHCAS